MKRNTKIKIGAALGALTLAVATPVALAQSSDDEAAATTGPFDGVICFEVDTPAFGDTAFGEMPMDGEWFDVTTPEFGEGSIDGFADELQELPAELVELLNQEAADLAAHLEAAGIAHVMVDGPMGEMWVEWDFEDEAVNAAVEEFFEGREDLFEGFEVFTDEFPFDDMDIEFGEFDDFEGNAFFGPFEVCIEAPAVQADQFSDEMAGLSAALTDAGVAFTTQTVEVEVPVWDTDDEAASDVVAESYTDLHSEEFGEIKIGGFEDSNGS